MFMHQEPVQEQTAFYEMSPRERLAFLIYKSDFEPSEFGLSLLAIGFSIHTISQGWPPSQNLDFIWAAPMLLCGIAQFIGWWILRHQWGRWVRATLALIIACLWLFLVLRDIHSAILWLYLFPMYTCFWALSRLVLRIRANAWTARG